MSSHRILLAEDSPTVQAYFQAVLESAGFEVVTAADGLAAAEAFFRTVPDAIVSDVEMPLLNGYHLCRLIKHEPDTRDVPFVLLTSLTEARYKFWGLEVGADRYVLKEEAEEKLIPTLQELFVNPPFNKEAVRRLGHQYGTASNIMGSLNRMLDEKLFYLTLVNSLTSLAFQNLSFNQIVQQVLEKLLHVIHSESVTVVICQAEKIPFFVHSLQSLDTRYIENLILEAAQYLAQKSTFSVDPERVDPEILCAVAEKPVEFRQDSLRNFFRRISDDVHISFHIMPATGSAFNKESVELVDSLLDFLAITLTHALSQEKIRSLSVIDSLTHLYNRRHFMSLLNSEFRRAVRHNLDLSVIFLDIDRFKSVNDTYGHLSGDLALKALSDTISQTIRTSDVAGRYGGEEFIVYLPETSRSNAAHTAERLRRNFETRPIQVNRHQAIQLTISLGVASTAEIDPGDEIERLIEIADRKMYQAKQQGRNRSVS